MVDASPVAALGPELRGIREGVVAEARAPYLAVGPDVEAAHAFRPQNPLVAGKGVHIHAGLGDVYREVANRLRSVHEGQSSPVAGQRRDLFERQNLTCGPVHVRERDEARLGPQRLLDLLRRHRGLDESEPDTVTPPQGVQGYEGARVLGPTRDGFVALPPVEGEDAEVHAVSG